MRSGLFATALLITLGCVTAHHAHAAVGRTEGRFDVSPEGAASYAVPIWVPPGPRGVQPSLALAYSSLGRNGSLGVGWSLAGLSAIERCPRVYPIDNDTGPVLLTNADRYCIGINRLRLTGGTYGAANSAYAKEVDDFSVITASATLQGAGPQSFTVVGKNGLTYEYGASATSRVTFTTNGTVLRWMLSKVRDRDGNSYTIDYQINDGVAEPTTISWSPTAPNGTSYRYTAVFAYVDKPNIKDWLTWYVAGNRAISKKRLSSISIRYQGTTVRKYVLSYEPGPLTAFSRLAEIKECANEAASDCLSPTVMTYQAGSALLSTAKTVSVASGARIIGSADFDGDRRDDLVYTVGTNWYVLFGNNSGFSAPVPVTGLTGSFGSSVDYDNFLPGNRAAFIANIGGTLYTFSAVGRTFSGAVSTGIAHPAGSVPTGVGAQLVWVAPETSTQTNRVNIRANITPPGATSPVFSPTVSGQGNSVPQNVVALGQPYKVRVGGVQIISDRGLERRDLEGDGFADFYATVGLDVCSGPDNNICYPHQTVVATFRYDGLDIDPPATWTIYSGSYPETILFNDDDCSDATGVGISPCGASAGIPLSQPASGFWMDWDGDGRSDLAFDNGGNIGVRASAGTGFTNVIATSIPYASDYRVLDINGDGLDDLTRVDGTTMRYYMRAQSTAYLTQYPDLLASVTDGYGLIYKADYVSTAHSNYQTGTAVGSTVRARVVVARAHLQDGIGGTYTNTYTYVGAREDKRRGTFLGFEERHALDSRTSLLTKTYFRQEFPRTGWIWKTEVLRGGSTLLALNENTDDVYTLDSINFRQRYFPYITSAKSEIYEPQGAQSLITRRETSFSDFDFSAGNVGTVTTTLTNNGGSERWTSVLATQYAPKTSGCLDLPSEVTLELDRVTPNQPLIRRKVRFTKDGSLCRHKTQTVEPDSTQFRVVTTYGYDGFGNVSSTSVAALEPSAANPNAYQAMVPRQSSIDWGSAGVAPEEITNALYEISTVEYYPTTGLLKKLTDPNGLETNLEYDGFGRLIDEKRPDQTHSSLQYNNCADSGCLSGTQHFMTVVQTEKNTLGIALAQHEAYLDRFDRLLVTRTPLVNGNYRWSEVQYDALGRISKAGIPCLSGSATASCVAAWMEFPLYDLLGRIRRVERPAGENESRELITTIAYDGLMTTVTDPLNRVSNRLVDLAGNLRKSTDANGYYQEFFYDSAGSLVQVTEKPQLGRNATLFTASYGYGGGAFQVSSSDRALGQRTRWYDGLGQLRRWRDAKNQEFFANYDALSRLVSRIEPDTQTTFEWGSNPAGSNVGQLARMSSTTEGQTYAEEFLYDSYGRLRQQRITLPGEISTPYLYDFVYHSTSGLLDTLRYPVSTSGYRFALKYDAPNGILKSVSDANAASTVFWALDATAPGGGINAFGQITHDKLGSGIVRTRSFDAVTAGLERITAGPSGNQTLLQNASIGYDDFGNVSQRQNNLGSLPASLTEDFGYGDTSNADYLDRLTHAELTDGTNTSQTSFEYDEFGNIEHKVDTSAAAPVDLTIGWTSCNYPKSISAPWLAESVSFAYGPDRQRWRMVYQTGSTSETTYYLGGLMEKVVTGTGTEYRHYIPGPDSTIGLYSRASSGTNTLRYVLTDHQGSIDTITNSAGAALVSSSFTPFGLRRDATDWSGAPGSTPDAITRQGYTSQTVLGRMGLNHMNGRVQDAISGTFLSPDPFIPDPANTQAFNRYAYVYNNPMTYTDPSGFSPLGDDDAPYDIPNWATEDHDGDGTNNWAWCNLVKCDLAPQGYIGPDRELAIATPGMDQKPVGIYLEFAHFQQESLHAAVQALSYRDLLTILSQGYYERSASNLAAISGGTIAVPVWRGDRYYVGDDPVATAGQTYATATLVVQVLATVAAPEAAAVRGVAAGRGVGSTARGLPNAALVVRGGNAANQTAAKINAAIGPSRTPGVTGFSAQCNGGTCLSELGQFLRNKEVGVTTVGEIRAIGGDVIATPGRGFHVTVTDVSGEAASPLFRIVTNPNPLVGP